MLIVGEDMARDSKQPPMWLVGSSNSQGGSGWSDWDDPTEMYSRTAGPKIWEQTGLRPGDIDVACMYDCFTYTVMATMEGFGFCEKGEVGKFFSTGRATYGGTWWLTRTVGCCPKAISTASTTTTRQHSNCGTQPACGRSMAPNLPW